MTWVFGILLVLALGGVAAVAAGRGMRLPEAYDDRTDSRVPEGPLSGADLQAVRFPLAVRGYRMGEVDELLDLLAAQLDTQRAEIERLRRELRADSEPDSAPDSASTAEPTPESVPNDRTAGPTTE